MPSIEESTGWRMDASSSYTASGFRNASMASTAALYSMMRFASRMAPSSGRTSSYDSPQCSIHLIIVSRVIRSSASVFSKGMFGSLTILGGNPLFPP